MTHTADAEPRLPHDYTTPPAAPVREYRLTPEEAARYPAVHPTQADFHDAAEAGWTPDRFAATYGRDAKHTDILRRAFRSVLDARDMRRRRGEDEDERPPAERSGPAVTTSEWIVRIKAVLREHPDWSRRQVADGLGTTTGVINNAMVRTGSNLTELRARVQRELAEATDNAAEIVDTGVQTTDKIAEVNSVPVPVGNEWLTQVEVLIRKHPHWRICDYAKSLGITQKALEQRLHHRGLRLKELKLELIHGCTAPTAAPAAPASEPPPTAPEPAPTAEPPEVEDPAALNAEYRILPACPICHRAVADCNHHGDCERSGRHEEEPADLPLPLAEAVHAARQEMERYNESPDLHPAWEHIWELIEAAKAVVADRPTDAPYPIASLESQPLPGTVEHLAANNICGTCVKADVCRHAATLADWFERAQLPDVDLDIEYDVVVRRCEAYRGEGAA